MKKFFIILSTVVLLQMTTYGMKRPYGYPPDSIESFIKIMSSTDRAEIDKEALLVEMYLTKATFNSKEYEKEKIMEFHIPQCMVYVNSILNRYDIKEAITYEQLSYLKQVIDDFEIDRLEDQENVTRCSITGLPRICVLDALLQKAKSQCNPHTKTAFSKYQPSEILDSLIYALMHNQYCIKSYGIPIYVDLSRNSFDPQFFDQQYGAGAAQEAVDAVSAFLKN